MSFTIILKKEILDNIYNFRYGIILALSVLLIGTSIFTMYRDYCARVENYTVLIPEEGEATAIIPPTPLSVFVKGLDENLARSYQINFIGISLGSSQQAVNRLFSLFTIPDLLYIIKIVLSLCALLMAYDIVTREKERGTLKLMLSNRVKRPVLLLAKWFGGFLSFIVPIVFVLLLMVAIVSLLPMVSFTVADYSKIMMFLLTSILYLAVFYTFGFLVSCLTVRSVTSLIISMFFWVLIVFVIPNISNNISKQLVKTNSIEQLQQQQNLAWREAIFHANKTNNWENMDLGWEKLSLAYDVEQNKQIKISKAVAQCSPAGLFTLLATDIMNTGLTDQNSLKNNAWQFYKQVEGSETDSDGNLKAGNNFFSHSRCSLSETLSQNILSFIILMLFVILFFAGAFTAFMRYDLR
ncbi:MAG: ABC transporter permease [Prevotellaceae bacterium]|jgi:ABC-type transport system involved in multi-copper enzyme maturation permease subunit|nr:ABC transporter permease [Prevotellaceae bacterium]